MKKKLVIVWGFIALIIIATLIIYPSFQKDNNDNVEKKVVEEENIIQPYHRPNDLESQDLLDEICYDKNGNSIGNPELDNDWNVINCYNEQWEQEGKWIIYTEDSFWKYRHEENYKNWNKDGKCIHYDENWNIMFIDNYKNWERDWEVIFYDSWQISEKRNYANWKPEWEQIEYFNGEWIYKTIYKNGEIIDKLENDEIINKKNDYYKGQDLRLRSLWNKFESRDALDKEEFQDLADRIHSDYNIYYNEKLINDYGMKEYIEDMYKHYYEEKLWELVALYSMMNCSDDTSNPDAYLFNLNNPQEAQEIYSKNCPKWCRYADEEDVDFICE